MAQARNLDNWKHMPIPPAQDNEVREPAWGKLTPEAKFTPMMINVPKVFGKQVRIKILYCGICHSDLHRGLNDLGGAMYPIIPGHEMVGEVTEVGDEVTKFKVGDKAGIGCVVDGCLTCPACMNGDE